MEKLYLIMPMAGGGTRFEREGFDLPKPLISLHEKPFFWWATESISKNVELAGITFVVLREHVQKHHIDEIIKQYYPNAKIVVLDNVLNGAVLTCMEGIKNSPQNVPLLFNDCDHLFRCRGFEDFCKFDVDSYHDVDGALLTFKSDNPAYSYVSYDENGKVNGTLEKKVVSNDAICGAYYFKNSDTFVEAYNIYMKECNYSEYFVSGLYNVMANTSKNICVFDTELHIPFGVPEEYTIAQNMDFSLLEL